MQKALMLLWRVLAEDLASNCGTSTTLDFKTVQRRVDHEGLSFLTIALPAYGSDFDRSLDQGRVDSDQFLGFKRGRRSGLPLFLGGFLSRVFDSRGMLVDVPCVDSIFAIRQLTAVFKKIELPCSDARVAQAIKGYIDCEQEVAAWSCDEDTAELFSKTSAMLFGNELSATQKKVVAGDLVPKHGPGATAERLAGNRKYDQSEWTSRLETVFPFLDFGLPSPSFHEEQNRVNFLEPEAERPVRVITVPKTLKTPRIIAIEPTCMQYMQQAVLEVLVQELEAGHRVYTRAPVFLEECKARVLEEPAGKLDISCDELGDEVVHRGVKFRNGLAERETRTVDFPKRFIHHFIGFTDQEPNRNLAQLGSLTSDLATLDLSEASDRVSNLHVMLLLKRFPALSEAVQVTRSTKADLSEFGHHDLVPLSKFASMGSALCFPMEAMVFLTVVFMGVADVLSRPLTLRDILDLRGKVRVYGDDIIVPTEYVPAVLRRLETFGFRVNKRKSFWTGKFRESCGGDYYDGQDVTPVRLRHPLPRTRHSVEATVGLVEFRNHVYRRGLWKTARYLDNQIAGVLPHFPIVQPTSAALGRFSYLPADSFWNPVGRVGGRYQRPLVKAFVPRYVLRHSPLDGSGALMKFMLKRGNTPHGMDHLNRAGRPEVASIKLRWIPSA